MIPQTKCSMSGCDNCLFVKDGKLQGGIIIGDFALCLGCTKNIVKAYDSYLRNQSSENYKAFTLIVDSVKDSMEKIKGKFNLNYSDLCRFLYRKSKV